MWAGEHESVCLMSKIPLEKNILDLWQGKKKASFEMTLLAAHVNEGVGTTTGADRT